MQQKSKFYYSNSAYLIKSYMNFYHQFVSEEINKMKNELNLNKIILIRTKENVNFNDLDKMI